jgi:hypothetical protein
MQISPQLEGASAELKAQIEVFSKKAEAAQWDLYPCRHECEGKVYARLYRQLYTETGSVEQSLQFMPPTLQHIGDGIFSLTKTENKAGK